MWSLRRRRNNYQDRTASARRSSSSGGGAAYMDENGHLIYGDRPNRSTFSWFRFGVIASCLLFLFATNPANQEWRFLRLVQRCLGRDHQPASSSSSYFYSSYFQTTTAATGRTTNFGLFSVKASTMKVALQFAGSAWDCRYDDPDIGIPICNNILRRHLTHQKPLLLGDPVWVVHRGLLWCLAIAALASLCYRPWPYRNSTTSTSKVPLWDSLRSLFWCPDSSAAVGYAAYHCLHVQLFIYPTLDAMYKTIQQQSSDSSFAIFDTQDRNFYLSCVVVLGMALMVNQASRAWSGQFLLQFDALTAVAMGYYAHYLESRQVMADVLTLTLPWNGNDDNNYYDNNNTSSSHSLLTWQMDWPTATWMLLVTIGLRRSLATALFWSLAHCAGQSLSEYQYNHLIYVVSARAVMSWLEGTAQSVERGRRTLLGGVPHIY